MTIAGWFLFGVIALMIAFIGFMIANFGNASLLKSVITVIVCVLLIAGVYFGMSWYYHNTASGARQLADQRSNLRNGLERTVTVYTANGEIIAQYAGKIDIEANSGGYVKFDFEGKRYIYYNCFVETIAELE